MRYVNSVDGVTNDGLESFGHAKEIWNVAVGASAAIKRGDLLCASDVDEVYAPVTSNADASKVLAIAYEDFIGSASATVTSAYTAGSFNRELINVGGLSIVDFEQELRKQNIHLTTAL